MTWNTCFKYILVFTVLLGASGSTFGQIKVGRIVYERRTNLKKLYGEVPQMKRFITEDNKIKTEQFELVFNDSISAFLPIDDESDERGPMAWMTTKNRVYQNTSTNEVMTILNMFGQDVYVKDSMPEIQWKITESKRYIGKYHCRKAMYEKNDSTRIYAWFAVELEPSIGPEGLGGLPGAILGLATEDGGIVYFAKEVEVIEPKEEKFTYEIGKNDVYSRETLQTEIEEKMGNSRWSAGMMENLFRWW